MWRMPRMGFGIGIGIGMVGWSDGWLDGWMDGCPAEEYRCVAGTLLVWPYIYIIELRMTTFSALCFAASETQLICQPLKSIKCNAGGGPTSSLAFTSESRKSMKGYSFKWSLVIKNLDISTYIYIFFFMLRVLNKILRIHKLDRFWSYVSAPAQFCGSVEWVNIACKRFVGLPLYVYIYWRTSRGTSKRKCPTIRSFGAWTCVWRN